MVMIYLLGIHNDGSQDHQIVGAGRDLRRSLSPALLQSMDISCAMVLFTQYFYILNQYYIY